MNTLNLIFFAARMEIWFPLSIVYQLTNLLGPWMTLQIAEMSSLDRLLMVHEESILWSSTSIMATVCLNQSLRSISSICLMTVSGWLGAVMARLTCSTLSAAFSSFCSFCSTWTLLIIFFIAVIVTWMFRDLLSNSFAITPLHDKLVRFALLVSLNSSLLTSYAKWMQAVISPATLTAIAGCYGWLSLFCLIKLLSNYASSSRQFPTSLAAHKCALF